MVVCCVFCLCNAIEICNGIMFNFYPGLPHMQIVLWKVLVPYWDWVSILLEVLLYLHDFIHCCPLQWLNILLDGQGGASGNRTYESCIAKVHDQLKPYRDSTITKWSNKTRLASGKVTSKVRMRLTLTRATNLLSTVKCFIKIYSLESFPLYGGSVYVSHSSTVVLDDIIDLVLSYTFCSLLQAFIQVDHSVLAQIEHVSNCKSLPGVSCVLHISVGCSWLTLCVTVFLGVMSPSHHHCMQKLWVTFLHVTMVTGWLSPEKSQLKNWTSCVFNSVFWTQHV